YVKSSLTGEGYIRIMGLLDSDELIFYLMWGSIVLGFAAVVHQVNSNELYEHINETLPLYQSRFKRSTRKRHFREGRYDTKSQKLYGYIFFENGIRRLITCVIFRIDDYYDHNIPLPFTGIYRGPRDNQMLIRQETVNQTRNAADCCPTVLEMVEPEGGKNQDGIYVELYRDDNYRQRFYELSCHKDILNKPCRFMDKKLHNQSICVQRHSYTYALVKDTPSHRNKNFPTFPAHGSGGATYTLDYISVRSGCSCVVTPPTKKETKQNETQAEIRGRMILQALYLKFLFVNTKGDLQ
ncbi:hypothetical protein NQ317_013140, partial [Molorchus minor]